MGNQSRQGKLKDILNIKSPAIAGASTTRRSKVDDATVDVGALMRKAMQAPKLRTGNGAGQQDAPARADAKQASGTSGVEFRGNPVYSPDDSLAKAASKLANLKAAGNTLNKSNAAAAAATPKPAARTEPAQDPHAASRKPRPSDAATPGWRPEVEGIRGAEVEEDVPLAAKQLINQRRRRKSVYQRPTRYGDWFDGDDEELERMVDEFNDDDEEAAAQQAEQEAHAQRRREQRDRAARRKSAFPAISQRENAIAAEQAEAQEEEEAQALDIEAASGPHAPPAAALGNDIASKVRAIADGLCERLDGIIEESPMVRQRDEKSLRDKLVESWEGRSYYERLMQMAGGTAEQEELQAELAAAKAASESANQPTPQSQQEAPQQPALSFLSPPKPKLRVDVSAALQAVAAPAPRPTGLPAPGQRKPLTKEASAHIEAQREKLNEPAAQPQVQQPLDISRGLLKVSARGPKPMIAPWQQQSAAPAPSDSSQAEQKRPNSGPSPKSAPSVPSPASLPAKVPAGVPPPAPAATHAELAQARAKISAQAAELEKLRAALAEAITAKEAAEKQAAAARAEVDEAQRAANDMELRLEEAEEDARTEATVRVAAEKRIRSLEAEVAALQTAGGVGSEGCSQALHKLADDANEVEGTFGLVEVQLESLMSAAKALAQQVASGRSMAQNMVEAVASAQTAAGEGQARKTRTTRRKSGWRG